ncbi:MAG TPA: Clp protease N-terminal domain-containing protein, partial [Pseudomonadales bacterium]
MRIERFTTNLQEALSAAQSIAVGRDNNYIEPEHIMLALVEQKGGSVNAVLKQAGFPRKELLTELELLVDQLPQVKNPDGNV